MLDALSREHDRVMSETMHRAIDLDRGFTWERLMPVNVADRSYMASIRCVVNRLNRR
ncbi:MAG TPA: hypothetical protein VFB42_05290 [Gaiellaceae bacterium]|nr:hypothetical protein [Gaiellaceae bacterium]